MPHLNEKQLRIAAALEAKSLGYGGVSAVAEATGIARGTIHRALEELKDPGLTPRNRSNQGTGRRTEDHRITGSSHYQTAYGFARVDHSWGPDVPFAMDE